MPRQGAFDGRLDLGLPKALLDALKAQALREGVTVAALVRRLLEEALAERSALHGQSALEKALRLALKPTEDRLAGLIAKAAHAAATSMFLNAQVLEDLGQRDVIEFYQQAKKKAAAYLRTKDAEADED